MYKKRGERTGAVERRSLPTPSFWPRPAAPRLHLLEATGERVRERRRSAGKGQWRYGGGGRMRFAGDSFDDVIFQFCENFAGFQSEKKLTLLLLYLG